MLNLDMILWIFFFRFDQYVKNADPSEVDLNKPFGIGRGSFLYAITVTNSAL